MSLLTFARNLVVAGSATAIAGLSLLSTTAAAGEPTAPEDSSVARLLSKLPGRDIKQVSYGGSNSSQAAAGPAATEATGIEQHSLLPDWSLPTVSVPDRIQWGWLDLTYGIQWRYRYHDEDNLRLNGQDDTFLLRRSRYWIDGKITDFFRGRIEIIDAISSFEDLPPRPIDENRWDLLNAWGELTLWNPSPDQRIAARIGRQELLYGSQRLISPLDWANTRRTFEGYRLLSQYGPFSLDWFWVRPFDPRQHVNTDHNLDHADQSQEFSGIWLNYGGELCDVDVYFLRLKEQDNVVYGRGEVPGDFDVNTLGARWSGEYASLLWDLEGGVQFGDYANLNWADAGFWTVGLGYRWANCPWQPEFWAFYDWASGDSDPNDGKRETAFQYFPFGHYYLGWADLVGRQNIKDWNFRASVKPHEKVVLTVWYHIFRLEEARDALYNAAGTPIRWDPSGASGKDVGQELDIALSWNVLPGHHLLFGYSRFYAGDFIANTGVGDDADFFYTAWTTEWPAR